MTRREAIEIITGWVADVDHAFCVHAHESAALRAERDAVIAFINNERRGPMTADEAATVLMHTIRVVEAERAYQRQLDIDIVAKTAMEVAEGLLSENDLASVCMTRMETQPDDTRERVLTMALDSGTC